MKIKTAIGITILAAFSLFAIVSFAQKGNAQTDTTNSNTNSVTSGTMGQRGTMYGGMMNGGMMQGRMMYGNMHGRRMMGRNMMGQYNSMQKMINRLASDLSAIRAEASSPAIQSKLADAESLMGKPRGEFCDSWQAMMHNMPMNGGYYCYWNQTGQQQKQQTR